MALEVEYAPMLGFVDPLQVWPTDRPLAENIEELPIFGIYSESILEEFGGLSEMFDGSLWYVAELPSGHTVVVRKDFPWNNREIELFERTEGLPHPVGVDILVNGLGCRQTEAEWSFDYLHKHSSPTTISGGTRSTTARAADGEVLVAAKLHSGRKTDLADVLAAVPSIDLGMVETHLHRGDTEALRQQLSEAQAFIEEGGLDHRFKSMVGQSSASAEDIETLLKFLKQQQK
ncbi:hypothetical protein [Natrinema sp. 74]|uniref:hypothetical protein n=1 Tax=Natrinema sp. 74 TaxID=3384159 RepID=UPI0038D3930D